MCMYMYCCTVYREIACFGQLLVETFEDCWFVNLDSLQSASNLKLICLHHRSKALNSLESILYREVSAN